MGQVSGPLYCTVLYYTVLQGVGMHEPGVGPEQLLYCTVLYCTLLYYTVLQGVGMHGPGVGPEQQQLLLHHPPALPLPPHGAQPLLRPGLLQGALRGITVYY